MVTIVPETTEHYDAIHEVNLLAFGREEEPRLVENLRQSDDFIPGLSLVAVEEGRVLGHILFSSIIIETGETVVPALTLAPMAVRPEFQNTGIGSELVRQGLKECQRLGYKVVVVIGHPTYYPRFRFSSAQAKGLEAPYQVPDEAFMVLELVPGALDGVRGMVKFPPAFDEAM